jgi:TolB-like protein/tetratricopeptide (TPR) repeat protein
MMPRWHLEGGHLAGFNDFVAELKRRRVIRALIGWGIFSFAVLQVYEPVMHGLHLPEWTLSLVVLVLAAGFPVTVVLAWIFDLGPGGVERTAPAPGVAAAPARSVRLAVLLVGLGAVVAVPGLGWYFWQARTPPTAASAPPAPPTTPAPPGAGTTPSLAVLPFADLSPNHDQDYFSDGVAEEILTALSKVEGLRVPGRASSFYFKGKGTEPAEIARKLGVTNLLEGSVRRAGNRLRITAEVVKADGERVWSQTFDRELTDVFALQDDIARAVVSALSPRLLAGVAPAKKGAQPANPEAYQLFLLGRSLSVQGTTEATLRGISVLEHAVQLDPRLALAWVWMGVSHGNLAIQSRGEDVQRLTGLARSEVERAIALDPEEPAAYAARAWIRMVIDWNWAGAQDDLDRASALQPATPLTLNSQAILLQKLGRFAEAAAVERRVVESDPLNAIVADNLGSFLMNAGKLDEAREMMKRSLEISPGNPSAQEELAVLDLVSRNAAAALEGFRKLSGPARLVGVAAAAHTLGREEESRAALSELERDHTDRPFQIAGVHAWRGDGDGAFRWLDRAYQQRDLQMRNLKVTYLLRPVRTDPRYAELLRKIKLPLD